MEDREERSREGLEQVDNFRGLLFEPIFEHEVVILFSLLIPYFKDSFVIDKYPDTFPDCFARRNGQKIGIEFEVLASHFYEHKHDQRDNLSKCQLLVCWKNNIPWKTKTRDGVELLKIKGYEIEILSLEKTLKTLQEEKSLKLIFNGERPNVDRASEERFFEQLRENVHDKKYCWIKELYDQVKQREDFEVKWGGGETWSTMRFYVKKWNVDPISIAGKGSVTICYIGNPAISHWELPQEVQSILRQMFKHKPKQKWPDAPLDAQADLDNIKRALEILAEYSKHSEIIWHEPQTTTP